MSNFLDDLFVAEVSTIPYAWTFTDITPISRVPQVSFGSGELLLQSVPDTNHIYYIPPKRYIDKNVKLWNGEAFDLAPPAFSVTAKWVNQLVIMVSPSGYFVRYGNAANFDVEQATFFPVISMGAGFPGIPQMRTGILTAATWTGVMQLVLLLPDRGVGPAGVQRLPQSDYSQST